MTSKEFTPHAFITLSNSGGLEIMFNRSNDGVYYRFSYGQDNIETEHIYDAEIEYTTDEDSAAFFNHQHLGDKQPNGTRYFLNEAMRIN